MHRSRTFFRVFLPFLLFPGMAFSQHYGFGPSKVPVSLNRHLLPDLQIGNVSLAVTFPHGGAGLDTNAFEADLETLIAQSGTGVRLVARDPEFQIVCFPEYTPPRITSKTAAKITTREAHGRIKLNVRLTRTTDGAIADAFTEEAAMDLSNGGGPGVFTLPTVHIPGFKAPLISAPPATDPLLDSDTDASLNSRFIHTIALRVASHFVLMNETISVLLAHGGKLDELNKLALSDRWSEYLEQVSTLPTPPDPADNAYLLYDIGVANEALGYHAPDPQTALKYLRESSINYSRAVEDKPSEKYFGPPQRRIEIAITRYSELGKKPIPPSDEPTDSRRHEKLTNADIIKLVQAHLDKGLIANKIATAPEVDFDLSVDGMVSLSKSGVPSEVIGWMTQRSQASPQHRPR